MTRGKRAAAAVVDAASEGAKGIQQSGQAEADTGKRRKRVAANKAAAMVTIATPSAEDSMTVEADDNLKAAKKVSVKRTSKQQAETAAAPESSPPDTAAEKVSLKRTKKPKAASTAAPELHVPDGKCRCEWSTLYVGSLGKDYVQYHDEEWGVPHVTDQKLFEHLTLDASQAGLSWSTILAKRAAYTRCFKQWDIAAVAAMTDEDVEELMKPESGIVRHRGKIQATVNNAKCVLEVQKEFGSLAVYLWSFVPGSRPVLNSWKTLKEAPTTSSEAEYLSKCLKKRGFKFVGPTMCYAMMQAVGMINDHTTSCFRYKEIQEIANTMEWPFPMTQVAP